MQKAIQKSTKKGKKEVKINSSGGKKLALIVFVCESRTLLPKERNTTTRDDRYPWKWIKGKKWWEREREREREIVYRTNLVDKGPSELESSSCHSDNRWRSQHRTGNIGQRQTLSLQSLWLHLAKLVYGVTVNISTHLFCVC